MIYFDLSVDYYLNAIQLKSSLKNLKIILSQLFILVSLSQF